MTKFYLKPLLLCLFSLAGIAQTFAHDIEVKNADGVTIYYNYINNNTELEVTYSGTYSNGYSGSVVIPETVTYAGITCSVTSIGSDAFYGCRGLTSISIPNSVTSIGFYAFEYCSGLTSVIIPNSVISIGSQAFSGCSGLTSVTIGNSVTSIGHYAFEYCSGLTSITIPNSVTSIGPFAFADCSGLTSIAIPNSVTSIDASAFKGCSGLTKITVDVNNSVYDSREDCNAIIATMSNNLISGCVNTIIPNSVTSIGNYAFSGCSGLTSVSIPNSVTSIGKYAFSDCGGLASVTIPNNVTSIGEYAFWGCSGLKSVVSLIQEPDDILVRLFGDASSLIYDTATLYVPEGTVDKYRAREGWKEFKNIVEGLPSSITLLGKEGSCATETERYDINGKRISAPQRGINVVKMSDGTVKKVLVK